MNSKNLEAAKKSGAGLPTSRNGPNFLKTNLISLLQINFDRINIESDTTIFDSENVSN